MRTPIIAGNWKMNLTPAEGDELLQHLIPQVRDAKNVEILVCPAMPVIATVAKAVENTNIFLGAQNMHPKDSGAFTGEASAPMLKALGCTHVILGHSERREIFNESDAFINEKVKAALAHDLIPILCVGESLDQREAEETFAVVGRQIDMGFKDLSRTEAANVIVAYEPIWAIGTGKTASPEQAQEVHAFIRKRIAENTDQATADAIRIQYGGSVKPDNVDELMAKPDIDGALVGGASLKADSFARLVNFT